MPRGIYKHKKSAAKKAKRIPKGLKTKKTLKQFAIEASKRRAKKSASYPESVFPGGKPIKRPRKVSKRAKKVIENKPELEALQLKVNPPHYVGNDGSEVIDAIENFNLQKNMYRGQAIQYMFRAGRKPDEDIVADLKKTIWFIEREIRDIHKQEEAIAARMAS